MKSLLFPAGFLLLAVSAVPAAALTSDCLAMAQGEPRVLPASYETTALAADEVKLTYIGHSSFIIESPGGVRIVTDYAGYAGGIVPDVVTMNHAHRSHYTDTPDPRIKHVLRGWNTGEGPAHYDITVGDVRIRNVTTDIRGGMSGREADGNSIFIFDVAGLCIGHLGHLHHALTPQHLGMIGRLDVVMVPVDGGYTMAQSEMLNVLKELRARIVIPMHYFGPTTLARFIATMGNSFELQTVTSPESIVSPNRLPDRPKLMVLSGY